MALTNPFRLRTVAQQRLGIIHIFVKIGAVRRDFEQMRSALGNALGRHESIDDDLDQFETAGAELSYVIDNGAEPGLVRPHLITLEKTVDRYHDEYMDGRDHGRAAFRRQFGIDKQQNQPKENPFPATKAVMKPYRIHVAFGIGFIILVIGVGFYSVNKAAVLVTIIVALMIDPVLFPGIIAMGVFIARPIFLVPALVALAVFVDIFLVRGGVVDLQAVLFSRILSTTLLGLASNAICIYLHNRKSRDENDASR